MSAQSNLTYRKNITFYCAGGPVGIAQVSHDPSGPWTFEDAARGATLSARCSTKPPSVKHRVPAPLSAARPEVITAQPAIYTTAPENHGNSGVGFGFALIAGILLLYFIPTIISGARGCDAHNGIFVVNIFLGWTFVGWVVTLAWAACGKVRPKMMTV